MTALALLALTTACGGGDDGDGDGEAAPVTTAAESTTTATTQATAEPTAEATTTTAPALVPQANAAAAIDTLLGAWRAGSRELALAVATPEAVDALFAVAPEDPEDRGCNEPPPGVGANTYCVFRLAAGQLQVRAAQRAEGFVVDQVLLSAA